MSFVLAGFCAVNCWVLPKLWEPGRVRRLVVPPQPPRGGTVVRMRPLKGRLVTPMEAAALLLAA